YLAIRNINVSGAYRVGKEEVVELSGLREGKNILSFKAGQVMDSIKSNPWVESVEVRRKFLNTVDIEVKERAPVALVRLDDMYLIDASGKAFKKFSHEDDVDLPVVTGFSAGAPGNGNSPEESALRELIRVLSRRSGFNIAKASEICLDPAFGFSVYTLEEGVRLDIGRGNFEEKFSSFDRIVELRGGDLSNVAAVDLNDSREAVLSLTTNAAKEGGEGNGKKG
ncbi:MAG: FtsQ-type POTRA domain-containing protein, partial [Deltaproteobacteria bacterium]